jgi:hypothetical protein
MKLELYGETDYSMNDNLLQGDGMTENGINRLMESDLQVLNYSSIQNVC